MRAARRCGETDRQIGPRARSRPRWHPGSALVAVIVGLVVDVAAGHLAPDPIRDPAVTAPGPMQVDQRGPRAAVAHPLHELTQVGPAPSRPGVPGVMQIVEPELGRQPRLPDPMRHIVWKFVRRSVAPFAPTNTRPAVPLSENSRRCSRSTGTTGSGIATVRFPASDFGVPGAGGTPARVHSPCFTRPGLWRWRTGDSASRRRAVANDSVADHHVSHELIALSPSCWCCRGSHGR